MAISLKDTNPQPDSHGPTAALVIIVAAIIVAVCFIGWLIYDRRSQTEKLSMLQSQLWGGVVCEQPELATQMLPDIWEPSTYKGFSMCLYQDKDGPKLKIKRFLQNGEIEPIELDASKPEDIPEALTWKLRLEKLNTYLESIGEVPPQPRLVESSPGRSKS